MVVAHETANPSSTIDNEVTYMTRNWQNAFVTHFVGGGGRVVQVASTGYTQWGAGAKANGYAYAQVELCRTKDKAQFAKDYAVYCQLLADLAKQAGIPVTLDTGSKVTDKGIKSHKWVTDKLGGTNHQDPYAYLASWGIDKALFAADLAKASGTIAPTTPKPQPTPSKPSANSGGSIVDYLNSKKIDSSMANRKKLAVKYGIANYTGTSTQNTALLNKLKAGAAPTPSKPVQSGYKGTSLVDYLVSVKKASDYYSRSKYAHQYGIDAYRGSTSQNLQLLKKMRGF
ncbi:N-acetylmuramoyl-L-alanine amidase [Listeria newyorkensis]|uniref:N-acetylmuramoyl-L-alanine amidase n=1 Tax=Listeria newyorkensis TaxID=1497681 RepID=UPI001F4CB89F|nr:N-acetylmuramoyl-L-alanine amidase [Listeria newyorkensis]